MIMCVNIIVLISFTSYAASVQNNDNTVASDVCSLYADNKKQMLKNNEKESETFCKIKKATSLVSFTPLEKIELFADYYTDEECELVWSIDGKSKFIGGESKKTAKGNNVKILFIDDSTVKLKLISSEGKVIAEDETFLKSYIDKNVSFTDRLLSNVLLIFIIFLGVIGGTFGPIVGTLF